MNDAPIKDAAPRLRKAKNLDCDQLKDELILMKIPGRVIMLNAAGRALWQGFDIVETRTDAIQIVREAFPEMDSDEAERSVNQLIDDLLDGGFLVEEVA
jgi:hypothetical protein